MRYRYRQASEQNMLSNKIYNDATNNNPVRISVSFVFNECLAYSVAVSAEKDNWRKFMFLVDKHIECWNFFIYYSNVYAFWYVSFQWIMRQQIQNSCLRLCHVYRRKDLSAVKNWDLEIVAGRPVSRPYCFLLESVTCI